MTTGPFRQLLKNYSPPWMLRRFGERINQGMIGMMGDLLLEYATKALVNPMLDEDESSDDAMVKVAASRMIDRYTTDTNATHRARTLDAFNIWTFAGTAQAMIDQINLMGLSDVAITKNTENAALPRRFSVVVSLENTAGFIAEEVAIQIFKMIAKFRAGEERCDNVAVMSSGRTWDVHPLTGLPHTWDDPGPGITTWDSSEGVLYRDLI